LLSYDTTYNTALGGIKFKPIEKFDSGLDLVWNSADAGLDPFRMPKGEAFAANKPNQSFDFSQTNTYSDLDTERWNFHIYGRLFFKENFWLYGGYEYLDYADNAPYLYDTSGTVDRYTAPLRVVFLMR